MEIKRIIVIDKDIIEPLSDLVDYYIREAGENDTEHKDALAVIDTLLRTNKGVLFGVFLNNVLKGYLAMELCKMHEFKIVAIVHQMYLHDFVKGQNTFSKLVNIGIAWAKDNQAEKIYFSTRRNSDAFKRLLGKNWTIDSTVLGLNLSV